MNHHGKKLNVVVSVLCSINASNGCLYQIKKAGQLFIRPFYLTNHDIVKSYFPGYFLAF